MGSGTPSGRLPYGTITKAILTALGAGAIIITVAALPGLALALAPFLPRRRYYPSAVRQAVNRLAKQRLVKFQQHGRRTTVTLTEAGRRRALQYQFEELALKKPKRWDGRWRIVVFDIPEERRAAREALRAKLRQLGYYQLQRSVFVTPHECREAVGFLKEFFAVDECVHYAEVVAIDCDHALRQYFEVERGIR